MEENRFFNNDAVDVSNDRPRLVSGIAVASFAVLTCLLSIGCGQARADELCGPAGVRYVEKIAAGMQQFAPKVTKTGGFAIKEESPGDGTQVVVIAFADRGKTIFVHRVPVADPIVTPTVISPGKTKSGNPEFSVGLIQGNQGACDYSVFIREAKFVVVSRGFVRFKR